MKDDMSKRIERVLAQDPGRWPLITRADIEPMYSTKIEWLVDVNEGDRMVNRRMEYNYAQIIRNPFRPSSKSPIAALRDHLDSIETLLRDGVREFITTGPYPMGLMGGVIDLLGRWPHKNDRLILKVLRPTTLLLDRQDVQSPETIHEWVTELSLMAVTEDA